MFDNSLFRSLAAVAALTLLMGTAQAVTIDMVPVGDAGNDPDTRYATPGYGGVDYAYQIGKYEVTNAQYAEFLNAVAAVGDANDLYNTEMGGGFHDIGGISRTGTGTPGDPWDYSPRTNRAKRPVNYVSWGDAARFANWLHNGQPSGGQDLSTTEDGSYYLNGATIYGAVVRAPGATWVIPSEDEWYKAAYYKGGGTSAGYWKYPTQSDSAPTFEAPPGTDMVNGSANYHPGWANPVLYTTDVGAYDAKPSDSAYGTYDQGGNLWEWNEAVFWGTFRGLRGGSLADNSYADLRASCRNYYFPADESGYVGFRVTSIPEPSAVVLGIVGFLSVLCWRRVAG